MFPVGVATPVIFCVLIVISPVELILNAPGELILPTAASPLTVTLVNVPTFCKEELTTPAPSVVAVSTFAFEILKDFPSSKSIFWFDVKLPVAFFQIKSLLPFKLLITKPPPSIPASSNSVESSVIPNCICGSCTLNVALSSHVYYTATVMLPSIETLPVNLAAPVTSSSTVGVLWNIPNLPFSVSKDNPSNRFEPTLRLIANG